MTGKDLIIYILKNNLENEIVIKDGKFVWLVSAEEVAEKCKVGVATVNAWYELGVLDGVKVGDSIFLFNTSQNIGVANALGKV